MAIKITGTTVINDSCELKNISNTQDIVKTANFVLPPQLFIDGESNPDLISSEPTLSTTDFSFFGSNFDTHSSTDWEVIRTSDNTTVFSSTNDTVNLTSINVTPALDNDEEYLFRVRHNGVNLGPSEYYELTKTTVVLDVFNASLGDPTEGGFYMGTISAAGTCYYIVVAPNSTGCSFCSWKTTRTDSPNAQDNCDGFANTYDELATSEYPAGNWTATRTINGFSDWYLPATEELKVFYDNAGSESPVSVLPQGEQFGDDIYWSSTEENTNYAEVVQFSFDERSFKPDPGDDGRESKTTSERIRAVRRVPV